MSAVRSGRRSSGSAKRPAAKSGAKGAVGVEQFRKTWRSARRALKLMFPAMNCPDSPLWGHEAFLRLVAGVHQELTGEGMDGDKIQALSKLLAEQRRVQVQTLEIQRRIDTGLRGGEHDRDGAEDGPNAEPPRELPPNFDEMVRQIYGVNLAGGAEESLVASEESLVKSEE